jgi:hypothetical protein
MHILRVYTYFTSVYIYMYLVIHSDDKKHNLFLIFTSILVIGTFLCLLTDIKFPLCLTNFSFLSCYSFKHVKENVYSFATYEINLRLTPFALLTICKVTVNEFFVWKLKILFLFDTLLHIQCNFLRLLDIKYALDSI